MTLLRRSPGRELEAASGHLVRRVLKDGGAGLGEAWLAVCGDYLLAARRITQAAAVAQVRAGRTKVDVAGLAGVSRTTLDAWLTGR